MRREALCLCLVGWILDAAPRTASAQGVPDQELVRGIRQVEEGDYDVGILTLDTAVRRLQNDPARNRDLSQAFLYLGIAYLATGHETLAKARFKEALTRDRGLSLGPEKFSARVLELFEKAREEMGGAASRPPAGAPSPSPAKKRGSSKTPLILLGAGGVAAAVGLAVAAGGSDTGGTSTPIQRTEMGTVTNLTNVQGPATGRQDPRISFVLLTPGGSGTLEASLTWTAGEATLQLYLFEGEATGQPFIAQSTPTGTTSARLAGSVTARPYQLNVFYDRCRAAPCPAAPFTVTISHP